MGFLILAKEGPPPLEVVIVVNDTVPRDTMFNEGLDNSILKESKERKGTYKDKVKNGLASFQSRVSNLHFDFHLSEAAYYPDSVK